MENHLNIYWVREVKCFKESITWGWNGKRVYLLSGCCAQKVDARQPGYGGSKPLQYRRRHGCIIIRPDNTGRTVSSHVMRIVSGQETYENVERLRCDRRRSILREWLLAQFSFSADLVTKPINQSFDCKLAASSPGVDFIKLFWRKSRFPQN